MIATMIGAATTPAILPTAVLAAAERAEPAMFYMHVLDNGEPIRLATALHDGLALSYTPFATAPPVGIARPRHRHDGPHAGRQTQDGGRDYQVGIKRADVIQDTGIEVALTMGIG